MVIRPNRGNTLAMVAAVTVIGLLVIIFALLYMNMVRSGTEHKTAIEAAAIAAAKDISRIVIDSPECGLVGRRISLRFTAIPPHRTSITKKSTASTS